MEGLERHFCEDPNIHKVRQVAGEFFDVQIPKFVKENPGLYPDCYQVLKLKF